MEHLSYGSTGRTTPNNYYEYAAMQSCMNDPFGGETYCILNGTISDPSWLNWSKWQYTWCSSNGINTDITFPVSAKTILHRRLSNVVSQIVHPAVREFAIRNLPYYNQKTNSISHSIAFTAFLNNYHPEDEEYIYELVTSITDTDHLHAAGMDLLHADAPISERVLIYLYENTPCSMCRCSFFNRLMVSYQKAHNTTLDSLPAHLAAIKEEAKHDCEQATRFSAHANYIEKGK